MSCSVLVRCRHTKLQSLGIAGRMDAQLANGLWQVHILLNKRDQNKRPVRPAQQMRSRSCSPCSEWPTACGTSTFH